MSEIKLDLLPNLPVVDFGDKKDIGTFIRAGMDTAQDVNDMIANAAIAEGASLHTLKDALAIYGHGIREVSTNTGIRRYRLKQALAGAANLTSSEYEKLNAFYSSRLEGMKIIITGAY